MNCEKHDKVCGDWLACESAERCLMRAALPLKSVPLSIAEQEMMRKALLKSTKPVTSEDGLVCHKCGAARGGKP